MRRNTRLAAALLVVSTTMSIALVGCSNAGSAPTANEASAEQSTTGQADWDSLEPVEFRMSTFGGQENIHSQPLNALAEKMEEVSGGKITFEIFYGGALVPATEQATAIANGTTDMGTYFPAYTASEFPIDGWVSPLAFTPDDSPIVGSLQAIGTTLDWAYNTPEYIAEFTSKGITPLLPRIQTSQAYSLLCTDPVTTLDEFEGKRIRIGGPAHTAEVEALGGVPVNLPNTEVFEGLQRGVIDCTVATLTDVVNIGLAEVATSFTFVPFSGWSSNAFGVNTEVWNSLPAFVQEAFLSEGLPAYLEAFITAEMGANVDVVNMEELTFSAPEQAIVDALDAFHETVLDSRAKATGTPLEDPRAAFEEYMTDSDEWLQLVIDAGYDGEPANWVNYVEKHGNELPDFQPWLDLVLDKVVRPNNGI